MVTNHGLFNKFERGFGILMLFVLFTVFSLVVMIASCGTAYRKMYRWWTTGMVSVVFALSIGCARTWVNYPPETTTDSEGRTRTTAARAIELNGSDSLGATDIEVTRNGVRYSSAGGIDNSTSTKLGYDFGKHSVTAGATLGTAGFAGAAYVAGEKAKTATALATTRGATAQGLATTKAGVTTTAINAGVLPIK